MIVILGFSVRFGQADMAAAFIQIIGKRTVVVQRAKHREPVNRKAKLCRLILSDVHTFRIDTFGVIDRVHIRGGCMPVVPAARVDMAAAGIERGHMPGFQHRRGVGEDRDAIQPDADLCNGAKAGRLIRHHRVRRNEDRHFDIGIDRTLDALMRLGRPFDANVKGIDLSVCVEEGVALRVQYPQEIVVNPVEPRLLAVPVPNAALVLQGRRTERTDLKVVGQIFHHIARALCSLSGLKRAIHDLGGADQRGIRHRMRVGVRKRSCRSDNCADCAGT